MKVYVMTKAELFKPEVYIGIKKTKKEATKFLREKYPRMKQDGNNDMAFTSDVSNSLLLFIHEEEIQ